MTKLTYILPVAVIRNRKKEFKLTLKFFFTIKIHFSLNLLKFNNLKTFFDSQFSKFSFYTRKHA